jgi:hypothetical protein
MERGSSPTVREGADLHELAELFVAMRGIMRVLADLGHTVWSNMYLGASF